MVGLWDSISAWFWDVPGIWAAAWRSVAFAVAAFVLSVLLDGPAWIAGASLFLGQVWFNMRYAALVRRKR
jgi:hypothetical protein